MRLGEAFPISTCWFPKEHLETAEKLLRFHGWVGGHHTPYDERYYRKWMHEIPPLMHIKRLTVIDLHHAILPLTARIKSDPQPLFENARALPGFENLFVLAPADMLLHSATHLFTEGEFSHGLRDLADLDSLFRYFSAEPGFWKELERRAEVLNLGRPLFYALRYCLAVFGTPIPNVASGLQGRPPVWISIMDGLFRPGFDARPCILCRWLVRTGAGLLYVRGHWLRMPSICWCLTCFIKPFWQNVKKRPRKRRTARPGPVDSPFAAQGLDSAQGIPSLKEDSRNRIIPE